MKKFLLLFSIIALFTACSGGGSDPDSFEVITGEIQQTFTIDWRSLPSNQNIAITFPERYRQARFIGIQDFDVQEADQFFDPTVSAMYYDIDSWDPGNMAGIFDVTISVVNNFGVPQRLTTFTINNLDNTTDIGGNNQLILSKERIYDNDEGNVTLDGLTAAHLSILAGRLELEVEVSGRNVTLVSPDSFDLILTLELSAIIRVD
ncbi:hypothetical protein [Roseivirga sp. E12]|uniref:hypothetical protein n=1 Tax=Roseivirga sp. E12 TaxID=2819237 RepID=UPI001ABCE0BE|nr:hypothetical protein [Roseivirga sp. E12]MBO3698270.1 hypothetical protein [Roseivirga sp. E12]